MKLILGPANDDSQKYDESRTASVHLDEAHHEETFSHEQELKFQADFSTSKSASDLEVNAFRNTAPKTKKKQNFLPRELLLFLGLEHQYIESYLEG